MYGLKDKDITRIKKIFYSFAEIEQVTIYGSRAKGSYKPTSDIDLTLIGGNINLTILNKIAISLDDLLLPYKFDISIHHQISNTDLLEHIERIGITFYKRATHK